MPSVLPFGTCLVSWQHCLKRHDRIAEHANVIVMFDLPPVPSAYGGCLACVKAAQPAVSVAFVSESELPVLQKLLKDVRLAQVVLIILC